MIYFRLLDVIWNDFLLNELSYYSNPKELLLFE